MLVMVLMIRFIRIICVMRVRLVISLIWLGCRFIVGLMVVIRF